MSAIKTLCAVLAFAALAFAAPLAAVAQVQQPVLSEEQIQHFADQNTAQFAAYRAPAEPDGKIDVTEIILGGVAGIASILATWLTAVINGAINKSNDERRATMIAEWTKRAVDAAANYVKGALPDHPVTFEVGSVWVERALEQCLALFPDLIAATGGEQAQRRRIWSHITLAQGEAVPGVAPVRLEPIAAATPSPHASVQPAPRDPLNAGA